MTKAQYQVRHATQLSQLEAYLNVQGRDGWRLAGFLATSDLGSTERYIVVMEREVK